MWRAKSKIFGAGLGKKAPARPWSGVTDARRATGHLAESHTAGDLTARGWRILARNARTRHGELDLVALDGDVLVFVEVKAGREGATTGPERPILSIGPRKQRRVRRLATAWMATHRNLPHYREIRFDAVGVTLDRADRVTDFEHIEGAF